jgi:small-conductance mechanosensitive channel
MLTTHPFRVALAALCAAAAMFGIAAVTDKGHGAGWTDGTQPIANVSWILMVLFVAGAAVFVALGVVALARRRQP